MTVASSQTIIQEGMTNQSIIAKLDKKIMRTSAKIDAWLKENFIWIKSTLKQKRIENLTFSTKNWCRHIIYLISANVSI